jgi:hypothetical protein
MTASWSPCNRADTREWNDNPTRRAAAGGNLRGAEGMKLGGGAPEKAACVALSAACKARLASMGTSLEDDLAALQGGEAAGRARVALQYRIRKKQILAAAVVKYDV